MCRLQILWGICLFSQTFKFIDPFFTSQKAQQQKAQQQQQQPPNSTDLKKCSSPKKRNIAAKTADPGCSPSYAVGEPIDLEAEIEGFLEAGKFDHKNGTQVVFCFWLVVTQWSLKGLMEVDEVI